MRFKRCSQHSKLAPLSRRCFCQWQNSYFQCPTDKYLEIGKSGFFSDVEVHGRESCAKPFKADRILLTTLGEGFKQKHLIGLKRKADNGGVLPIIHVDLSQKTLKDVLDFAYTGRCSLVRDNLVEIMSFAAKFEIGGLLKLGLDFMSETINPENAVQMYNWARIWMCERVINKFYRYILLHFAEVAAHSAPHGITELAVPEVIGKKFFNCSQMNRKSSFCF